MPAAGRGTAAGAKQHKCSDCDKTFSRREYVVRHARLVHQGDRPFSCPSPGCGSSFARSDLLKRHEKTCRKVNVKEEEHSPPIAGPSSGYYAAEPQSSYPPLPTLPDNQSQSSQIYGYASAASTTSSFNTPTFPGLSPTSGSDSLPSPETPPTPFGLSPPLPDKLPSAPLPAPIYDYHPLPAMGQDQTLAPGFHRSFSQDEITASEVLEDLLRSPTGYAPPPNAVNSNAQDWSSAVAPAAPSQLLPNLDPSSWQMMYDGGGQGIENSPAALALADYFNKGGVGGISALDFGFTMEPSLFPDHCFEPQIVHDDTDMRFFLPAQKFNIGYLFPWNIPKLDQLMEYGKKAAESFLPQVPIVHPGTLNMSEMPVGVAFGLTVAGAAFSAEGTGFSNEMLVEKRCHLTRSFSKEDTTDEQRFTLLQSMLMYQLLGLFHHDEQQRLLSHTFHGALVSMFRQLNLPERIRNADLVTPHRLMNHTELDAAWKAWIEVETRRRVAFIVYLADLETATTFNLSPFIDFSELQIDLPSSDAVWNAASPQEWLALITSPLNPTSVSFVEAIKVLLSPSVPAAFDSAGILLAELGRLSSFPLVILTRTLSFLQHKTEEAMKQVDPYRSLLGGFGMLEGREQENRDVLARILRGKEMLRRLPGGAKRGGGEKWFEGVIPGVNSGIAADFPRSPPPPVNSDPNVSAEEDYVRKVQAKMDSLASHTQRREQDMLREFPDAMVGSGFGCLSGQF